MKHDLLCSQLGYQFQSENYLKQALTHRSASSCHNERLEFLGDAILNFIIAHALFERFPQLKEGELSLLRAKLVNGNTLAAIAKTFNLGEMIALGPGEIKTGGKQRTSILSDTLEAIFGAVYLDGGIGAAEALILKIYRTLIDQIDITQVVAKDPKTELQEYLHAKKIPLPTYHLLATHGVQHDQQFDVLCCLKTLDLSEKGRGKTRRQAEQNAAKCMLAYIKKITNDK